MLQKCFHSTWWGQCCPVYVRCPPLMPLALTLNPRWRHQSNRHSVAGSVNTSHSPFLFTLPSSILLLHATVIMPSIRVSPQKFTSTCLPLGAGARLGRLGSAPPIRAPCTQQSWAHAGTPGVVCTWVLCVHLCACVHRSTGHNVNGWAALTDNEYLRQLPAVFTSAHWQKQLGLNSGMEFLQIECQLLRVTRATRILSICGLGRNMSKGVSVKGFVLDYSESNDHERQYYLIKFESIIHNMEASVEWPAQKVVNM